MTNLLTLLSFTPLKTLYIVRHAKSSWKDHSLSDIDRPLNERGKNDILETAHRLGQEGTKPGLLLASPAVRARETAKVLANKLMEDTSDFITMDDLYLPGPGTLTALVRTLDNRFDTVMIVGHEPSLSTFINQFLTAPLGEVVTSSVTMLRFETATWQNIGKSTFVEGHHRNRHNWQGTALR